MGGLHGVMLLNCNLQSTSLGSSVLGPIASLSCMQLDEFEMVFSSLFNIIGQTKKNEHNTVTSFVFIIYAQMHKLQ